MNEIRRKSGTYGTMFNCGLIAIKAHSRGVAVFCDWGEASSAGSIFLLAYGVSGLGRYSNWLYSSKFSAVNPVQSGSCRATVNRRCRL